MNWWAGYSLRSSSESICTTIGLSEYTSSWKLPSCFLSWSDGTMKNGKPRSQPFFFTSKSLSSITSIAISLASSCISVFATSFWYRSASTSIFSL